MMSDIPPTLQEQLKPLFLKKDDYSEKLCRNGKEIRKVQLELMKAGCPEGAASAEQIFDLRQEGASKETLLRSQRLIDETAYLTAKLRALEREIDGVLTQEMLVKAGCPEGAASAEQVFEGNLRVEEKAGCPEGAASAEQVFEGNLRVEEKAEG